VIKSVTIKNLRGTREGELSELTPLVKSARAIVTAVRRGVQVLLFDPQPGVD